MLHVLYLLFPISAILRSLQIIAAVLQSGSITGAGIWFYCRGLLVTPILFSIALIGEGILANAVRKRKSIRNIYTRPLIPSFIFIFFADIFMLISAIFKGTLPHKLFLKYDRDSSNDK